jgi:hypothetical protein
MLLRVPSDRHLADDTMTTPGIIERAYELAGQSASVAEIRRKLIQEGYFQVHAHLGGRQIRRELMKRLHSVVDPRM